MSQNQFEIIKCRDNNGQEYWSSRELVDILVVTYGAQGIGYLSRTGSNQN